MLTKSENLEHCDDAKRQLAELKDKIKEKIELVTKSKEEGDLEIIVSLRQDYLNFHDSYLAVEVTKPIEIMEVEEQYEKYGKNLPTVSILEVL